MKINQIISETTTSAGSVAPVEQGFVKMHTRNPVVSSKQGNNLLTGTKTKKKYMNSLSEGKMKELAMDLRSDKDGLNDANFLKKYGKTKEQMRKTMADSKKESKPMDKVDEAKLKEDDVIIVPGQGRKLKPGLIPHGKSRVDHEVEMARSDLLAAVKNAKSIFKMIENVSEEDGLEGWVQEKIIKANDYLNAVKEYMDNKQFRYESVTSGNSFEESVVNEKVKGKK